MSGDAIVHAESVLDEALGGPLRQRFDLGVYPGHVGTSEIVVPTAATREQLSSAWDGSANLRLSASGQSSAPLCVSKLLRRRRAARDGQWFVLVASLSVRTAEHSRE
jgi:hypothetical protein